MNSRSWFYPTETPGAVIIIRLMTGTVFLSEGIQKFLFTQELGIGRFIKIGIPNPEVMASLVGCVEIVAGSMLLLGLLTRLASIPLLITMSVAIYTTKLSVICDFWKLAHEARTDYSMIMGLLFLFLVGAGPYSLDRFLFAEKRNRPRGC